MILTDKRDVWLERVCVISDHAFHGEERAPHGIVRNQFNEGTVFVHPERLFLGYAIVITRFDEPYLWSIAVIPMAQGQGVGSELLKEVTTKFPTCGLTCRADNPAKTLYEKHGFRVKTVMHGYYENCDGLFMRRQI